MPRDSDDEDEVTDDDAAASPDEDDSSDNSPTDDSDSYNAPTGNDMDTADNDSSTATEDGSSSNAVPDKAEAADAVQSATPEEDDAHRGMLGEVLGVLDGQGIDINKLAQQYGLPHVDVDNMSAGQIVQLTQKLAQEHPEVVSEVSQRFPMAQGLLSAITGGGQDGGSGGGIVGGLLGRFLH